MSQGEEKRESMPDPEVVEKARRRQFSTAYKQRIDPQRGGKLHEAWGDRPDWAHFPGVVIGDNALSVRFHIDPCPPRSPESKGKVERRIRDQRLHADPRQRVWTSLEELQGWSDEKMSQSAARRRCPATGTSVLEAWREELPYLAPLPPLPEPFDVVVHRRVARDCTVQFEGRTYSVPFALIERRVEVRGGAGYVQVLSGGEVVARHPRHTERRIVLDPSHFEGEATDDVLPPSPLGRMGRRLEEIAAMPPEVRPLDLYAALAEVAR